MGYVSSSVCDSEAVDTLHGGALKACIARDADTFRQVLGFVRRHVDTFRLRCACRQDAAFVRRVLIHLIVFDVLRRDDFSVVRAARDAGADAILDMIAPFLLPDAVEERVEKAEDDNDDETGRALRRHAPFLLDHICNGSGMLSLFDAVYDARDGNRDNCKRLPRKIMESWNACERRCFLSHPELDLLPLLARAFHLPDTCLERPIGLVPETAIETRTFAFLDRLHSRGGDLLDRRTFATLLDFAATHQCGRLFGRLLDTFQDAPLATIPPVDAGAPARLDVPKLAPCYSTLVSAYDRARLGPLARRRAAALSALHLHLPPDVLCTILKRACLLPAEGCCRRGKLMDTPPPWDANAKANANADALEGRTPSSHMAEAYSSVAITSLSAASDPEQVRTRTGTCTGTRTHTCKRVDLLREMFRDVDGCAAELLAHGCEDLPDPASSSSSRRRRLIWVALYRCRDVHFVFRAYPADYPAGQQQPRPPGVCAATSPGEPLQVLPFRVPVPSLVAENASGHRYRHGKNMPLDWLRRYASRTGDLALERNVLLRWIGHHPTTVS